MVIFEVLRHGMISLGNSIIRSGGGIIRYGDGIMVRVLRGIGGGHRWIVMQSAIELCIALY